jgi:Fe-S cluster assembly protein SufD
MHRAEKAFQDFVEQGIPTRKNENYKYTNLQPSFMRNTGLSTPGTGRMGFECRFSLRCTTTGNTPRSYLQTAGIPKKTTGLDLPKGVIFESLEKIAT